MVVRRIKTGKRRGVLIVLRAVVIPSVAEGSFLHCGQYHISTGTEQRLGATYFCFHTCIVYRSAKKISRFARNDDTGKTDVSQSLVTSH